MPKRIGGRHGVSHASGRGRQDTRTGRRAHPVLPSGREVGFWNSGAGTGEEIGS